MELTCQWGKFLLSFFPSEQETSLSDKLRKEEKVHSLLCLCFCHPFLSTQVPQSPTIFIETPSVNKEKAAKVIPTICSFINGCGKGRTNSQWGTNSSHHFSPEPEPSSSLLLWRALFLCPARQLGSGPEAPHPWFLSLSTSRSSHWPVSVAMPSHVFLILLSPPPPHHLPTFSPGLL